MDTHRIDRINCWLVIIAFCLSALAPFHLLVTAYVLLGPLHYLTEISWLDKQRFFLPERRDGLWLLSLALIGTLLGGVLWLLSRPGGEQLVMSQQLSYHVQSAALTSVFLAWCVPLVLWVSVRAHERWMLVVLVSVVGTLIYYFGDATYYFLVLAVLLPTLVHVFGFTVAFMLYGAMKARSRDGLRAVVLLVGLAILFLLIDFPAAVMPGEAIETAYRQTLGHLNSAILRLWNGGPPVAADDAVVSLTGLRITRFVAFAYTYHYLNWFSKTTLIGWHRASRGRVLAIAVVWVMCVACYCLDYSTGLMVVGFLSLLHVFLEFPLNWLSIRGIANQAMDILRRGWQPITA